MGSLLCGTTFTSTPTVENQQAVLERAVHRNHIEALPLLRVRAVSYYGQYAWYFVTYATFYAPLGHRELPLVGGNVLISQG